MIGKLKQCKKCLGYFPLSQYTSTRARFCSVCFMQRKMDQRHEMMQRSLIRSQNKKQKTSAVISLSDLKKAVQREVNAYVRLRDEKEPCISCQRFVPQKDAGHFLAQGSTGILRYDLDNLWGQCQSCNRFKHGNLLEYRINLVKKIGLSMVERLESMRHETKKWTREELLQLRDRIRHLKNEQLKRSASV